MWRKIPQISNYLMTVGSICKFYGWKNPNGER
jgi:hypothetical protein